jgi:hypothetical protein
MEYTLKGGLALGHFSQKKIEATLKILGPET